MSKLTFTRDFEHRIDALTHVKYRGGRSYAVSADVEAAARAAGAIKEKVRGRSGRRGGKGGAVPSAQ